MNQHKSSVTSSRAQSTPLPYTLMNDYMFHAVLQKNQTALKGLVSCLLELPAADIKSTEILNPIILGERLEEKTCILDLRILLNNGEFLNIEMQVIDYNDWPERSLYYLSRSFANLNKGDSYADVTPCTHVGILNFNVFRNSPAFFSKYLMTRQDKDNPQIYSDKFAIRVLELPQIDNPNTQKKYPKLFYWARLFLATSKEEIDMLSKQPDGIQEAVSTLKELSADEKILLQCEAREKYEHEMASATASGIRIGRAEGKAEGKAEGIAEGMTKGKAEGKAEVVINMLKADIPLPVIINCTGLSEEEVSRLADSL